MPTQMAAAGDYPDTNRACTADEATTAVRRCWSSMFPDDLLALIFCMLASPRGRARFVAVCRSWRAAARAAPHTALPWLLLSPYSSDTTKRLYCPEDGSVVCISLPLKRELVGCHDGGWVATFKPASLKILNILSGAKVKLGQKQESLVCGDHVLDSNLKFWLFSEMLKIVFSEPPTSPGCILATIVNQNIMGQYVGLCRIGCPNSGWTFQRCHGGRFVDITFCNSVLYGLTENGTELVKFEIGMNEDGAPVVLAKSQLAFKSIDDLICLNSSEDVCYIFDLHGKLAMARMAQWSLNIEPFFKVFELVDIHANELTASYKHKWVEVMNLGDHALFLGRTFSTVVHVPVNRRGGVGRNHIYFSHNCWLRQAVFLATSNGRGDKTYCRADDGENDIRGDQVKRIRSVGYFTIANNKHGDAWVLPPDI